MESSQLAGIIMDPQDKKEVNYIAGIIMDPKKSWGTYIATRAAVAVGK